MKHLKDKVIVKIGTKQKETLDWVGGTTLKIEKGHDFNLRQDLASMGFMISSDYIPQGSRVLLHHLSSQISYEVADEDILTDEERKEGYKIFSIPEDNVFCFRLEGETEWQPAKNYLITLRMYQPYLGALVGIDPIRINGRLWVLKGGDLFEEEFTDLSGTCCIVTDHSDYEIIFHDTDNKEYRILRTRNREISAIDHYLTEKVNKGEILLGLNENDCVTLNELK